MRSAPGCLPLAPSTPQGHRFTRGSPTPTPRRLAAYGRNAPDLFICPRSTSEFTKCSPPASTPVHVSQSKRDQRIPFHACLARWFPHLEIHFLQTLSSHGTAAWWGMPRIQICAPFLLLASTVTLQDSPEFPSALSSTLPTYSLPQATILPTVTQMVIHHPKASQHTRHLDILGSMTSPAVSICGGQSGPHRVFWDLRLLQGRISSRGHHRGRDSPRRQVFRVSILGGAS